MFYRHDAAETEDRMQPAGGLGEVDRFGKTDEDPPRRAGDRGDGEVSQGAPNVVGQLPFEPLAVAALTFGASWLAGVILGWLRGLVVGGVSRFGSGCRAAGPGPGPPVAEPGWVVGAACGPPGNRFPGTEYREPRYAPDHETPNP